VYEEQFVDCHGDLSINWMVVCGPGWKLIW
jgi:hypothetical protein